MYLGSFHIPSQVVDDVFVERKIPWNLTSFLRVGLARLLKFDEVDRNVLYVGSLV